MMSIINSEENESSGGGEIQNLPAKWMYPELKPSTDETNSSLPYLCDCMHIDQHDHTSQMKLEAGINFAIFIGVLFLIALPIFFGLQKLARSGRLNWITQIFSDSTLNGGRTKDDSLKSFWSYYYHQIWDVTVDNYEKLGWDGSCYLGLYKLIILLTFGIGLLSMFLMIFNHEGGVARTDSYGNESVILSLSFSNMNSSTSYNDVAHSSFNLVFFVGVLVIFILHYGLGDWNQIRSTPQNLMLAIWDIEEWAMIEKDLLKWTNKLFPIYKTIHFLSRKTGKEIGVGQVSKDLVILIEFNSNDEVQSGYKHQKNTTRSYFKIGVIDVISMEDLVLGKYLEDIEHPWKRWLTFVGVTLGCTAVTIGVSIAIIVSTHGVIGIGTNSMWVEGSIYPYLRIVFSHVVSIVLNMVPDLVGHGTGSRRHFGYLATTVLFHLVFNLILPMLHFDDGIDLYKWFHSIKESQASSFWSRLQCIFRPTLTPKFIKFILTSSLFLRSTFSIIRLGIILTYIWFYLKKKIGQLWKKIKELCRKKILKKEIEPAVEDTTEEEKQWNDKLEFKLGVRYGEIITHFNMTVVAGTTLTPFMVYPISLIALIIRYFFDKHDLVHTFKHCRMNPFIHQAAILFTLLPFPITAGVLTVYNWWRNYKNGATVVSMASTVMSAGSFVVISLTCTVLLGYILYSRLIKPKKESKEYTSNV